VGDRKLRGQATPSRARPKGQALVEFAIALPILMLLVAGVLELGRGYGYAVAMSDAARDGARFAAGKTALTDGPGLTAICKLITADLTAVTTNVSCPTVVGTPPPFTAPTPAAGQAVVLVYCGASVDCRGTPTALVQSEIDIYIYYQFSDLNLLGGGITISGSSSTKTSW
jgi:Flp pilus assembly protein TadG